MKVIAWIFGIIVLLAALFGILQTVASERVEVIELHTRNESGEPVTTRLWIVDHDGKQYLRGNEGSGWVNRLRENGSFDLTRGDQTDSYTFTMRPDKVSEINRLYQDKYTWGDTFFETVLGGRESALVFELQPLPGIPE